MNPHQRDHERPPSGTGRPAPSVVGVALGMLALLFFASVSFAEQGDYPDNVVVILDASGSMKEPMSSTGTKKMDAAKEALLGVIETIPPSTQVGLLVFSARNMKSGWAYELGTVDVERLQNAIRRPAPGGRTPLGKYLKIGADALLKQREEQFGYGTFRLLVVTDGEASDPSLVDGYLPDILSRGITIDAIGVDMTSDHALATRVHSYRRADDPQSLKQAVSEVFAEVSSGGADSSGDDTFELLAGIPTDMAEAMLVALRSSGNHPIGQSGRRSSESGRSSTKGPASTPSSGSGRRGNGGGGQQTLFILLVIFAVVIGGAIRKAKSS